MPDGTSSTLHEIKISELPVATAINDADQLEANQAGTSRSITVGQVKAAAVAAVPVPPAVTDVSPRNFGAVGDGIHDDTLALQAAINAVSAAGGGNINCTGGRWLIDSADLLIKAGVYLVGPWGNIGQPPVTTVNFDYSNLDSAFIVNSSFTLRLKGVAAGIQGMAVLRKGLTTPSTIRQAVDLVAAFAGTGVTIGDGVSSTANDCWLAHLFVAGFATGIANSGNASRSHIEWIAGDNLNGLYLINSYDMQALSHVHMYPFLTALTGPAAYAVTAAVNNGSGLVRLTIATSVLVTGDRVTVTGVGGVTGASGPFIATVVNPTTIDLVGSTFGGAYTSGGTVYLSAWYRAGVGINFDSAVDWGQMDGCFSYNYATGIRINSSDQVTLINCGTDSYAAANDTSTVGMMVTGTCRAATLVGCKTAAQGVGLKCDTSASARANVHVDGHRAWGNLTYAYQVSQGYGMFVNCEAASASVIRIDDAALGSSFVSCDLSGSTFSFQSNSSSRPQLYNVRGQANVNPVANGANGAFAIAKFEGHMTAPTANDTLYKSYVLTNSAGAQIEMCRESYRATAVTAGAMASSIFWSISLAGTLTSYLQLNSAGFGPLVHNTLSSGYPTANWSNVYIASGGAVNWNNGSYTLVASSGTLTASGPLAVSGAITSNSATAGIGFATGAGGTVTQGSGSGKATAVTLNNVTGQITMNNASLAANTGVSFTLTNSAIGVADLVLVQHQGTGTAGAYTCSVQHGGAGSGTVTVRNLTAGALAEAIILSFVVIRAVTA